MTRSRRFAFIVTMVALAAPAACSLAVDLDGYSGGDGPEDDAATADVATDATSLDTTADTSVVDSQDAGAPDTTTADTNVVDTADTGVTDSGAPDTTLADTSVVDTAVADTTVVDTSVSDTGVFDTGALDTGPFDTGTPDTGPLDTGVFDTGAADTGPADTGPADTGVDAGPACRPVINEVVTAAASLSDEFVEIYNPCTTSYTFTNVKVVYRSTSGTTDTSTMVTLNTTLAAGGYLLLGATTAGGGGVYSKAPYAPDVIYDACLAVGAGGVALRDSTGVILDSVTYGSVSASHPFTETTPAVAAPQTSTGTSIARRPNGKDTNNNSADFVNATPTPKAAN